MEKPQLRTTFRNADLEQFVIQIEHFASIVAEAMFVEDNFECERLLKSVGIKMTESGTLIQKLVDGRGTM